MKPFATLTFALSVLSMLSSGWAVSHSGERANAETSHSEHTHQAQHAPLSEGTDHHAHPREVDSNRHSSSDADDSCDSHCGTRCHSHSCCHLFLLSETAALHEIDSVRLDSSLQLDPEGVSWRPTTPPPTRALLFA